MPLDPKLTTFTTASEKLVSYSYTDVADGTGVQTFYGNTGIDSTGQIYFLSQNVTTVDTTTAVVDTPDDKDFDLTPFNSPRDVKGTATIFFKMQTNYGSDTAVTFTLYKYDGSAETQIGQVTSGNINSGTTPKQSQVQMTLTPTHFNTGDILRLNVTCPNGTTEINLDATDPLRLEVPFELVL